MQKIENLKLTNEELLKTIVDDVASGGSLIDLANTWQIRYCDLIRWINEDSDRKKEYEQAIQDRGEWFVQRIIKELQNLGFADFESMYNADGSLKKPSELPKEVTRWINSVDVMELPTGGVVKKIKFESKLKALEMLGKNLFMFVERRVVLNGDATDNKFRDEFFGLGKKQQDDTATGGGQ